MDYDELAAMADGGQGYCRSCGEEYGYGCSVGASNLPGTCASCAEAIAETFGTGDPADNLTTPTKGAP